MDQPGTDGRRRKALKRRFRTGLGITEFCIGGSGSTKEGS